MRDHMERNAVSASGSRRSNRRRWTSAEYAYSNGMPSTNSVIIPAAYVRPDAIANHSSHRAEPCACCCTSVADAVVEEVFIMHPQYITVL